jgi:hypothetical protein
MNQNVPGEVLNELFLTKLDTEAGKEKIAQLGSDYIRDRLREESFSAKVLAKRQVSRSELQVSVNHDYLVKIVEIEPQSRAMSMSFRGQPSVKYYTGDRFECAFHTVGSLRYEQTEQELMAYSMPITQIIRQNIVNDIAEVEDRVFLGHIESACQALQKDANSIALTAAFADATAFTARNVAKTSGGVKEVGKAKGIDAIANTAAASDAAGLSENLIFPVQKDDMIKLFQLFTGTGNRGSRLRCDQFLITDTDFEDINSWALADMGDKIVGETSVDGYKYSTVIGRKFIRTLKTDILRPGNIYAFAAPEFLGGFMVLNKLQFYADKERNRVSFEAWEDIGMYIGNIAGCRKLELYAGAVEVAATNTATESAYRAKYLPVAEDQLGKKNNLVAEGGTFPNIQQF